ncbi:MAG: hypothetical protein II939_11990 [Bacteroidales bacterium]|nr:hypothetical protein [Bacteroidales bacterium]
MRTIKFVNPAQFTNRGTVAFLEQVIESAKLIDSKCDKTMFENLESVCKEFYSQLQNDSTVQRTQAIVDTVAKMKTETDSVFYLCKALANSGDQKRAEAAKCVLSIFDKYNTPIRGYVTMSVKVSQILSEIASLGEDTVPMLYIGEFVERAGKLHNDYITLYNERAQYMVSIIGKMAETRDKLVDQYRKLVLQINGAAVANPDDYAAFVDAVNSIGSQFVLASRSRSKKQDDDIIPEEDSVEIC